MLILKRISLSLAAFVTFTFFFGCNTDTIKDLENRIAELENQASDTVFVSTTDTLIITNTDTLYISNLDTLYIFDTVYLANDSIMIGDVRLFTQEMIDEFGASGIKKVVGRLEIQVDETVSLSGLINLQEVVGSLVMDYFGIDFQGLNNLESVTELIIRQSNSLQGLESLKKVDMLNIHTIGANLNGLSGLESVDKFELFVGVNFNSLQGLSSNLTAILEFKIYGDGINFSGNGNSNLLSLDGLENITVIGLFEMSGFNNLNDISGLSNVTEMDQLNLNHIPVLNDLEGLTSLTKINKQITLSVGEQFHSLAGLSNVELLGGIGISAGYDNDGNLIPNNVLTSLEGLTNIAGVTKLEIWSFQSLSDISALSNLPTEVDEFYIYNTAIQNLNALSHIVQISGVTEYSSELNGMYIGDNPNLTDFCGVKVGMEYMEANSIAYNISGNAFNPQTAAEVVACN